MILEKAIAAKTSEILRINKPSKRKINGRIPQPILNLQLFQPFVVGAQGNFPYYYLNPANNLFNTKTYEWIAANLRANSSPTQLDNSFFTNLFIDVLSKVNYTLSPADQQATEKHNLALEKKLRTLIFDRWINVFGKLPKPTNGASFDFIGDTILNRWSNPPVTTAQIKNAHRPLKLINQMPEGTVQIVQGYIQWIQLYSQIIETLETVTRNRAYLANALRALQSPSEKNGMPLDDGSFRPSYTFKTPLNDIISGLNQDNEIAFDLVVRLDRENQYKVSIKNGATENYITNQFLQMIGQTKLDYFKTYFVGADFNTKIHLQFKGITQVEYAPTAFDLVNQQNWYWIAPIVAACQNGSKEITGFKFSPTPQVEFSSKGSFGFLTKVAIAKSVFFTISIVTDDYLTIAKRLRNSGYLETIFLNIPLGKVSLTTQNIDVNHTEKSLMVKFSVPLTSKNLVDSVAYVLGVETIYPVAA